MSIETKGKVQNTESITLGQMPANPLLRWNLPVAFTFQQSKILLEWQADCKMWGESEYFLAELTKNKIQLESDKSTWTITQKRDWFFNQMRSAYNLLKGKEKLYSREKVKHAKPKMRYENKELKGNIFRLCPAASERAVCCNLKVLNVVDNCAMACSYCVLQNHYDEPVVKIPSNLKEKLHEIRLSPSRRYRIGTGEYSDSLLWGNKNELLKDLCDFASAHSNIILEFKTKSSNVHYFLNHEIPPNVCCSWSLNPQIVIDNEEHKTASLNERLDAARSVAERGIRVGFHIHPMMYFKGWEKAYSELIGKVLSRFHPNEVLWVSLGSVTLMKGFHKLLRGNFNQSKILQMETEETPDGKITYASPIREKLYRLALERFKPWSGKVFQYLCMEHKPMWDAVMDHTYPNMQEFEDTFNESAFAKLPASVIPCP